jgi:hypothetical protein
VWYKVRPSPNVTIHSIVLAALGGVIVVANLGASRCSLVSPNSFTEK